MTIEPVDYEFEDSGSLIKVIGVGGGGCNAVNHMVEQESKLKPSLFLDTTNNEIINDEPSINDDFLYPNLEEFGKIEYYAVNTDAQALRTSKVQQTIQIGGALTRGLGAGSNPNVGRKAAEEDRDALRQVIEGADMVFLAAGMGGGTGTGATPVIAQIAKELGILTVAVVTKPFSWEGKKKMHFAELGIKELSQYVDSLIIIPNEKLIKVLGKNICVRDAFNAANGILHNSVTGISDMITSPGIMNVDFEDVKTVMTEMGRAMMGSGFAKGKASEDRAEKAVQEAIASPLLEDVDLQGAKGILVNVTAGPNLTIGELDTVANVVHSFAADDAIIKVGTALLPELEDEIRVTLVATGIGDREEPNVRIRNTNTAENIRSEARKETHVEDSAPQHSVNMEHDPYEKPAYLRMKEENEKVEQERKRDFSQVNANVNRFINN